ncbi:MAG: hypothetical protein ABIG63_17365 [Chloroflexota bacterium]
MADSGWRSADGGQRMAVSGQRSELYSQNRKCAVNPSTAYFFIRVIHNQFFSLGFTQFAS